MNIQDEYMSKRMRTLKITNKKRINLDWMLKWMKESGAIVFIASNNDTKEIIDLFRRKNGSLTVIEATSDSKQMYDRIMNEYSLTFQLIERFELNPLIVWVDTVPTKEQLEWGYCNHLIISIDRLPKVMKLAHRACSFLELATDTCLIL